MRFDASQHMRLNQQMKLAPRMIQSMEILQMPFAALQERIEQELESNVALEEASPHPSSLGGADRMECLRIRMVCPARWRTDCIGRMSWATVCGGTR